MVLHAVPHHPLRHHAARITLRASRGPDTASEIHVKGGAVGAGLIEQKDIADDGTATVGIRKWTNWLGHESFVRDGMPTDPPTFRSLIRHLARFRTDSLIDPFRTLANQGAEAVQAENAYLLNLDWRFAKEWANLRDRKSRVALVDDPDNSIESRIAAIEPHLVRLLRRTERLTKDITTFSVLPEYRGVESRVQKSTLRIKTLGNENFTDRQQLALYESQVEDEFMSSNLDVERLFSEAGIVLGDAVVRSLDEAPEFQGQIITNRAAYLADETRRLRDRVLQREAEQARLAVQQEQDMLLLRTGGALDDLAALQRSLAESQVEVAQVEEQIRTLRDLSDRKSKLKSEELDLVARTKLDMQERFDGRAGIIARFGEIMEALYGEPADLRVSPGKAECSSKSASRRQARVVST